MTSATLRKFLRRVESMSISGTEGHWALIPPQLAKKLRPRVAHIADAYVTLLATSDSLRMNRVIGLGSLGQPQSDRSTRSSLLPGGSAAALRHPALSGAAERGDHARASGSRLPAGRRPRVDGTRRWRADSATALEFADFARPTR
jgi:hypothetical protein